MVGGGFLSAIESSPAFPGSPPSQRHCTQDERRIMRLPAGSGRPPARSHYRMATCGRLRFPATLTYRTQPLCLLSVVGWSRQHVRRMRSPTAFTRSATCPTASSCPRAGLVPATSPGPHCPPTSTPRPPSSPVPTGTLNPFTSRCAHATHPVFTSLRAMPPWPAGCRRRATSSSRRLATAPSAVSAACAAHRASTGTLVERPLSTSPSPNLASSVCTPQRTRGT